MRSHKPAKVRAEINVTPLVDVVLVLLIIFMVITPMLHSGPPVELPKTEQPPEKAVDGVPLTITIERDGAIWFQEQRLRREELGQALRQAAVRTEDPEVVIEGDARLCFGEVKLVMAAVKNAGFTRVGLIANRKGG